MRFLIDTQGSLPTIEQLEAELNTVTIEIDNEDN